MDVKVVSYLARRPFLAVSVCAHAVLLALAYYFGSYQPRSRQQEADITSSLHATHMASVTKRLQDLAAIKQLLEDSADRESRSDASAESADSPETADEMVERARELSRAIEKMDRQFRAEELAELSGDTALPDTEAPGQDGRPVEPPSSEDIVPNAGGAHFTAESAALEVAALEARARHILSLRQARLEAVANGVRIFAEGGREAPRSLPGTGASSDVYGSGDLVVPAMDPGFTPGHGRMLGPGGEYANRIYVNSWYIIGPFAAHSRGRQPDATIYPPEQAVLLDAVYLGKDGQLLKWRYMSSQRYPLMPPDAAGDAIYYGYTEVSVDEDCDFTAWIGADDDAKVYLNDEQVWQGGSINLLQYLYAIWAPGTTHLRDYNLTEGRRLLHFNKGRNKLFFKLLNGRQGTHLSLVLTRDSPCG